MSRSSPLSTRLYCAIRAALFLVCLNEEADREQSAIQWSEASSWKVSSTRNSIWTLATLFVSLLQASCHTGASADLTRSARRHPTCKGNVWPCHIAPLCRHICVVRFVPRFFVWLNAATNRKAERDTIKPSMIVDVWPTRKSLGTLVTLFCFSFSACEEEEALRVVATGSLDHEFGMDRCKRAV